MVSQPSFPQPVYVNPRQALLGFASQPWLPQQSANLFIHPKHPKRSVKNAFHCTFRDFQNECIKIAMCCLKRGYNPAPTHANANCSCPFTLIINNIK